jgi:hypothetical protein
VAEGDTLQEFHSIESPFLMADGRLAVPQSGSGTIRVFDADGAYVTTLGRAGTGPGEFRHLTAAWSRGDTIEALDFLLRRITRFLPDGSADVVPLQSEMPDLGLAGPLGDGWFAGGVLVGRAGRRDLVVLHRFGRDGTDLGEITRAQGMARYSAAGYHGPEPLSPTVVVAGGRGRMYVAETLTPTIQVFDPTGTLNSELAWLPEAGPTPREVFEVVMDSAVARAGPDRAALTRQHIEAAGVPAQLSAFWTFIVDDEGFIWVRPYDPLRHAFALGFGVGPGGQWTILSPEGIEVGSVQVPADIEPVQITTTAVVGIVRDSLGVESVRVHALDRR